MNTTHHNKLLKKLETVASNPIRKVLTKNEQLEVASNARLILRLNAPIDIFDEDANNQLMRNQSDKIKQFCDLLHENLVTEYGCALIAIYSCE